MEFLFSLFKSASPDLTKERLLEDLRHTRMLLENLGEFYDVAMPVMSNYKFQDKKVVERVEKFKRLVGTRDNPVVFFDKNIPVIIKNLDKLKSVFMNETNRTMLVSSLTIKQANMLAYVSALYLVNKGARKFLVWMEAHEAAHFNKSYDTLEDEIAPAEEKWLNDSFIEFCQATKIVTLSPDKTIEKLDGIVDAQLNEQSMKSLQASGRAGTADPLMLGLIGTKWNPLLFGRMMVAEWQATRLKEAEYELQGLKLQMSRLENISKGRNDPADEQEIKYMRSRIRTLSQEVAEMEAEYA